MREIKFRGFNRKNEKWLYGYYFVNRGKHFIVTDGTADPFSTCEDYIVDPDTVGQYTGQKDRNGKEIFEGDIINYIVGRPGFFDREDIEWRQYTAVVGMRFKIGGTGILAQKTHCFWDIDVIGNIHDNPELLEETVNEKRN